MEQLPLDEGSDFDRLFELAYCLPEPERPAFLASLAGVDAATREKLERTLARCSEIERLSHFFAGRAAIAEVPSQTAEARPQKQQIGPYKTLRMLGEGGMGTVYLVERSDGAVHQQVALKLIHDRSQTRHIRERFEQERQALAVLRHPAIATMFDWGQTDDGEPYYTMEYFEGMSIVDFCRAHLQTIAARVELLIKVAAALAHAHQHLIVHRDIKPSNILVRSPKDLKVLDFGIAKFLDQATSPGVTGTAAAPMTLECASPEQIRGGQISVATDIYQFGVLCFRVLSGHLPYTANPENTYEWLRAVVEDDPILLRSAIDPPQANRAWDSALASARARRSLTRDLDAIVHKAMAKKPEDRYRTMDAMIDDFERFLARRPVRARRTSALYRAARFVTRHSLPLAAGVLFLLVIVGGSLALFLQARQMDRQAQASLAVKDFLLGLFTAVSPSEAKGREITAHELLDRGAHHIERNQALDLTEKAEIQATLGRIYYQIGLFEQADSLQQAAASAMRASGQALLLAQTEADRAMTLLEKGDIKTAEAIVDDAAKAFDSVPAAEPIDRVPILHAQIGISTRKRDFAATKRYADAELVLLRGKAEAPTQLLFRALLSAGNANWGLNEADAGVPYFREALAVISRDSGPDDQNVALAQSGLALGLSRKSEYTEAKALYEQALATRQKVLGPDHPRTIETRRDVALCAYRLGNYREARESFEQVLATQRRLFGPDFPEAGGTEINLGLLLTDMGDLDAAEKTLSDAAEIFRKKFGDDHEGTRLAMNDLAAVHLEQGKLKQAEKELSDGLERERRLAGAAGPGAQLYYRLGEARRRDGNIAGAEELDREALEAAQKQIGKNNRITAMAHHLLGLALRDARDISGAESELRAALAAYASYIPNAEHPDAATTRYELGTMLADQPGGSSEGIRLLEEATTLRERFLGLDDKRTKVAREALERVRHAQNRTGLPS